VILKAIIESLEEERVIKVVSARYVEQVQMACEIGSEPKTASPEAAAPG
jgi:hypothetical protein